MRQTPVDDYLEEISTELPEELYGNLSDAIYETVCEFDEEVAQLKDENAKLRELVRLMQICIEHACMCDFCPLFVSEDMDEPTCIAEIDSRMRALETKVG